MVRVGNPVIVFVLVALCACGSGEEPAEGGADASAQASGGIERNPAGAAEPDPTDARSTVEFRSYNLRAGTRAEFHRLVVEQAIPMLERWNVDVVGYGPSPHDTTSYFLIRAFASAEERQRSEDAFYDSVEWRDGPREAILARIDSYTTIVLELDGRTIEGLRMSLAQ
jgi:hypothetical protein